MVKTIGSVHQCLLLWMLLDTRVHAGQKVFLSQQAFGFLWLPKIQHAGLTHRFQVSVADLSVFVCLFVFVLIFFMLSVCLYC